MIDSSDPSAAPGGVRERKQRETRQRITEAGLRLFAVNGFEGTTLDTIAAEAGISRRTFFHYFKSKDDILLSLQGGAGDRLIAALDARAPDERPLTAVRRAVLGLFASWPHDDLLAIDRLMRSSETVQARKQAGYVRDEAILFAALRERWPVEDEAALRLVALLAIGIIRLTLERWSNEGGRRPIDDMLNDAFDALDAIDRRP